MSALLKIVAWLFIAQGLYELVQQMLLYAGNPSRSGTTAVLGLVVLWAGLNLATGIGLLGQGLWARSLGTYFSGFQVLAGIVSFFWNFSGSSSLLWSIAIVTLVCAFQFWALVFGTTYLDYAS